MTDIARSITQLAELFRDLSEMVISQGSLLDSIEYNIDQTAVNMEEAVRDLNVAEKYVFVYVLLGQPSFVEFILWNLIGRAHEIVI